MSNEITGTFNNASGLLGVDKDLVKDFTIWHYSVSIIEIIGHIGSSSTALLFLTCVPWLYRKINLVLSIFGFNLLYSWSDNLDFGFLRTFCIFLSVNAVGSVVIFYETFCI